MIAPCDPHGTSAAVVAGDGGGFFGGDRRKKRPSDFKGLGWPPRSPAHFPEIRPQLGKNTETRPPRPVTEGLGEAPPPRIFSSSLSGFRSEFPRCCRAAGFVTIGIRGYVGRVACRQSGHRPEVSVRSSEPELVYERNLHLRRRAPWPRFFGLVVSSPSL